MGGHVQLWGGPEDGATLWVPVGELPRLVGVHRTEDGALVPIRGRSLNLELAHVTVYEHVHLHLLHCWRERVGDRVRLFDPGRVQRLEDVPLYVHRDLVTRWTAQGSV